MLSLLIKIILKYYRIYKLERSVAHVGRYRIVQFIYNKSYRRPQSTNKITRLEGCYSRFKIIRLPCPHFSTFTRIWLDPVVIKNRTWVFAAGLRTLKKNKFALYLPTCQKACLIKKISILRLALKKL